MIGKRITETVWYRKIHIEVSAIILQEEYHYEQTQLSERA